MQHLWLAPQFDRTRLGIAVVDAIYGASALLTLVAGVLLVAVVGKPAAFYLANPVFHIKATLFVVVALLSLYPTLLLVRASRCPDATVTLPKSAIMVVRVELLLLLIMPLLAVLMAAGRGLH